MIVVIRSVADLRDAIMENDTIVLFDDGIEIDRADAARALRIGTAFVIIGRC